MASVIYNGAAIIPAPLVSFTDESILAGNQQRLGTTYKIQIEGTMLAWKGSPASAPYAGGISSASWGLWNNQFWINTRYPPDESNPTFSYHQLAMIESKQEALRNLFSNEGEWLEFQSADGSAPLKMQPKNINIVFQQDTWFQTCKYTITAETDIIYLNGQIYNSNAIPDLIQNASETWEIQPGEAIKTFQVNHNVSAIGKRVFTSASGELQPAWQTARDFVNQRLVLGWEGTSTFSPISGQGIFNQSALGAGVLSFPTFIPYNFSRTESVDELAGSYSCTESWLASSTPSGSHIYTVSTRRIADDPYTNIVSNIQGTIKGFYDGLFNYDQRFAAAEYVWSSLAAPTGLLSFISATYSGVVYNLQPRAGSIDYNYNEGTLNYQYEFSNTLYEDDAFEQWTLSRKTSTDNYITSFGIGGTVKGRRYDGDGDVLKPFERAYNYWTSLSGNNYNTLYQRIISSTYFPEAGGMGIQVSPINQSIDLNEAEGIITYNLEFNNRSLDSNYDPNSVSEEYQINKQFNREDGITHYSINGTVKGLSIVDVNARQSKFANASGYFYTYVQANMYNRISNYYGVTLPDTQPMSIEIGIFPVVGEISYSYSYWNVTPPMAPNALSEHIVMSENNYNRQVQRTANIDIPGRLNGPIIQNVNTTIVKTRSLSIETIIGPGSGGNVLSSILNKPSYDSFAQQVQPANSYCTNWTDTWEYRLGKYSLNCEWINE